jgi:hypothetical protein
MIMISSCEHGWCPVVSVNLSRGKLEMHSVEALQQCLRHPLNIVCAVTVGDGELKRIQKFDQNHLFLVMVISDDNGEVGGCDVGVGRLDGVGSGGGWWRV